MNPFKDLSREELQNFPCRPVGMVEYSGFAKAIDSRIETRCHPFPAFKPDIP